jgi:acyl-CoA synthetase (AMP-forming)/AMP-acid ligase II
MVTSDENVYPAEVESVMTGYPAVAEVAVVPSADWGESPTPSSSCIPARRSRRTN